MPADQMLAKLLRALQHSYAPEESSRLLSTAATLLVTLTNPLNLTLLTSQLLIAPAVWTQPDGLKTCLYVLRCFHSATVALAQRRELDAFQGASSLDGRKASGDWIKAVVRGADQKSPRWRHLLPIAGLLMGSENGQTWGSGDGSTRRSLLDSLVKAVNLALEDHRDHEGLAQHCIAFVVNHTFDSLPEARFREMNHEALLPILVRSTFFSEEGIRSGYFLGPIDADVVQFGRSQFTWASSSPTYGRLEEMLSRPLVASLGQMSRLIGQCLEQTKDPSIVCKAVEEICFFSKTLGIQWRQVKLSEIDISEEATFIEREALETTVLRLWDILKVCMFTCTTILRAVITRTIIDPSLAGDGYAPFLAMQTLHTLRHMYFILNRFGTCSFSTNVYLSLTAVDILSYHPDHLQAFLTEIQPRHLGQIPAHPLDRTLDHFFLNVAEQITVLLPSGFTAETIIPAASPYLDITSVDFKQDEINIARKLKNTNILSLREILESAHGVILAVFSAPQNVDIASRMYPSYVDVLFNNLHSHLSPRQFRLAFRILVQVSSPPSALSAHRPDFPAVLLELLRHRALHRPPSSPDSSKTRPSTASPAEPAAATTPSSLSTPDVFSPKTLFILTIIDSLPFIAMDLLEEWLPITATLVRSLIEDEQGSTATTKTVSTAEELATTPKQSPSSTSSPFPILLSPSMDSIGGSENNDFETGVQHFWNILSSGEMGVDRAQLCVAWWNNRGGRDMLLFGKQS